MSDELRYKALRSGCEVPSSSELSELTARLILVALCDHADREGSVFVGYRTLAAELNCSHSTTLLAYKLFEAHRVLVRTGKRKGTGGAIMYRIHLDGLAATNPKYYLPTALSTQATSSSASDLTSDPASALASDQASDPASALASDRTSALSMQARSRSLSQNRSGNTSPQSEALFRQALELELEFKPCKKYSPEKLADRKREEYLPVCDSVLADFPEAQPLTSPDRELALLVAGKLNPGFPALQLTDAGKRELHRRYKKPPAPDERPLTLEQIQELRKRKPFGQP